MFLWTKKSLMIDRSRIRSGATKQTQEMSCLQLKCA